MTNTYFSTLTPTEKLIWACGLFEVEGCFSIKKANAKKHTHAYISANLGTTDKDAIEQFHSIVGFGKLYGPYMFKKATKPIYRWSTTQTEDVQKLIKLFYPLLSDRRQSRCRELLELAENIGPKGSQFRVWDYPDNLLYEAA